jgi:hypothetical protein
MSRITKQDTNGVKPLLSTGELGYDNYPTGGDVGRVYVGTGAANIALAKKTEVTAVDTKADTHIGRVDNPHNVTKSQVGLANVDNTSDASKPVSTAQATAIGLKADIANPVFTGNGITIPVLASDPSGAVAGQMYYNSTDKAVKNYDGTSWTLMTNKFSATGGTVTDVGGYRIHTFTSSGTFTALSSGTVEYLIVAGGGGGATDLDVGGGGGAGGLITGSLTITPQSFSIVVGAGGTGGTSSYTPGTGGGGNGSKGGNSSAFGLTAIGGGYGGTRYQPGGSGGSGGGGGDGGAAGGAGTSGQGYAGGTAPDMNANSGWDEGGGGGAGGAASSYNPGPGVTNSISGTAVTYAAGGRGQGTTTAAANTGNGGRGANNTADSTGGSGIVIIRYPL